MFNHSVELLFLSKCYIRDMKKLLVTSDSHLRKNILNIIRDENPDMDYYINLGDSVLPKNELKDWICVLGNHDYVNLDEEKILNIEDKKILLTHSHLFNVNMINKEELIEYAKNKNIDIVLYGHIHLFKDEIINGIRFINPGSAIYNRDGTNPSYAVVEIDSDEIKAFRKYI